jgi:hypothetical protein
MTSSGERPPRQPATCALCGKTLRRDDAISTQAGRVVHGRCLPRTSRVDDDETDEVS